MAISLNFERGDYLGFKFVWKGNSSRHKAKPYKNNQPYEETPHGKLKDSLDFNEIEVNKISKVDDVLILDVNENNSYANLDNLNLNVTKAIADSEIDHEEVVISYSVNGLKQLKDIGINENKAEILYSREKESRFFYSQILF